MRAVFVIAALLAVFPAGAAEYNVCLKDADCVAIKGACPGWEGVNKTHAREREEYNEKIAPMVDCRVPEHIPGQAAAICREGICVIAP